MKKKRLFSNIWHHFLSHWRQKAFHCPRFLGYISSLTALRSGFLFFKFYNYENNISQSWICHRTCRFSSVNWWIYPSRKGVGSIVHSTWPHTRTPPRWCYRKKISSQYGSYRWEPYNRQYKYIPNQYETTQLSYWFKWKSYTGRRMWKHCSRNREKVQRNWKIPRRSDSRNSWRRIWYPRFRNYQWSHGKNTKITRIWGSAISERILWGRKETPLSTSSWWTSRVRTKSKMSYALPE